MSDQMQEIREACEVLFEKGQTVELRALGVPTGGGWTATFSGYFDDFEALAGAAVNLDRKGAKGVYITPNPVEPDLIARANNRAKRCRKGDPTTTDEEIECRRWLLVDFDPKRPPGISSTDEELKAARDWAVAAGHFLDGEGWPGGVLALSGNGAHLLYRIDEPAADGGLINRVLEALDERFSDDVVEVDTGVYNPARIWKLYGTTARKGDPTDERPHRRARIIRAAAPLEVVPTAKLQALAETAEPAAEDPPTYRKRLRGDFKQRIKDALTANGCARLIAYAKEQFGTKTETEPNGDIRILGNGGLLIVPENGTWNCRQNGRGGDCLDLIGYAEHGAAWDHNDREMFKAVLKVAAAVAGVPMNGRVHQHKEKMGGSGADSGTAPASDEKEEKPKQSERLIQLAAEADLFHTGDGQAYATFTAGGRTRTARISSPTFTNYLRRCFYEAEGKPPSNQALQDARAMLAAQAEMEGEEHKVHVRVAGCGSKVYVDLANDRCEIVEIDARGWRTVRAENAPVKFRRPNGLKPMPEPKRGGSLDLLRNHVRVQTGGEFALLLGYLVQALRPVGPYPALVFVGEQGTGKSTACRMIRALVDPSHVPVRTRARNERDLVIAAENGWMLAFDNLSGLPDWLSDAFCRLSTGGGFGTRQLYANREEELFYATRPLLLNGIEDLTTRPDLADRALVIRLEPIAQADRKTEREVWKVFNRDAPSIVGALFSAVSAALASEKRIPRDLPRMADFAAWADRAEAAFPVEEGTFLKAYRQSRDEQSESAVENDTVATAIRAMLGDKKRKTPGGWRGKTSELLEDLRAYLPDPEKPPKDYPKTYQAMGNRLRRIMPVLRAVGIERKDDPRERSRAFRLFCANDAASASSASDPPVSTGGAHRAHPTSANPTKRGGDSETAQVPLESSGIEANEADGAEKRPSERVKASTGASASAGESARKRTGSERANRRAWPPNGDSFAACASSASILQYSNGVDDTATIHELHPNGEQREQTGPDDFDVIAWEEVQRRKITDAMNGSE